MSTQSDLRKLALAALAKLGWSRKGSVASLRGPDALVAVSFQKSQYDALYLVNVGIWLLALGDPPEALKHHEAHLQFRLERIVPELSDALNDATGAELAAALQVHGDELAKLGQLDHLRQLFKDGRLVHGGIRKEAHPLLAA